jgi:hypothetical protein
MSAVTGGTVEIMPNELFLLHWMAALTADSPPRFEILVEPTGAWTPPGSTPDYAIVAKRGTMTAIGPVKNTGGWHVWFTARSAGAALGAIPEGSSIDIAMAPIRDDDDEHDPAIGRARYSGTVNGGVFRIEEASPGIDRDMLAAALAFVRDLAFEGRLTVRDGPEREAFDSAAEIYSPEEDSLEWDDDVVRLAEPDERTMLILASSVFRVRFGRQWPVDVDEEDDEGS